MRTIARIIAAGLIALALAGSVHVALQAQAAAPVFLPAGAVAADARPLSGVTVLRWRLARIDFGVLAEAQAGNGPERTSPTLLLNLFPDVSFLVLVDGREPTFSGGYALHGALDGVEMGAATLVINGPVVAGTVRTPAATYRIRSVGADVHVIEQVDLSTLPDGAAPLVPLPPESDGPAADAADAEAADDVVAVSDDGSVIDVAVFYEAATRAGLGGTAATNAEIDKFVAETNAAYGRTGLTQRIRLVARDEVSYSASTDMLDDVLRLTDKTDGWMDGVHAVRDAVGADLVHLLVESPDIDTCGIAWAPLSAIGSTFESAAFGVTDYRCGAMTFAHELGHNMGLRHDRYVLSATDRVTASYPWSFGYVNQRAVVLGLGSSTAIRWKTIMAYGRQCSDAGISCLTLPAFSSPDWTYEGDSIGVAGDDWSSALDGPADASRTLEATRLVVANFRQSQNSPCSYTLTPTRRYVLARGGGPFEFTVTASASSCSWTPSTDAGFLDLHTVANTGSGIVSYSVAPHAGLGLRTGVIRVGGNATFTVTTGPTRLLAPESGGVISIAAAADADLAGLRRWDVAVDRMARSDTLRLQARHTDPAAPGRTHEKFVQHHHGVPVHGAGVNREIDRGLAVSIAGVVHESITVGTDPGLSAAEAAGRFEAAAGGRLAPGRAPALTVLPLADGSYALTWKMTHGDGKTAFVDAHDGRIVSGAP